GPLTLAGSSLSGPLRARNSKGGHVSQQARPTAHHTQRGTAPRKVHPPDGARPPDDAAHAPPQFRHPPARRRRRSAQRPGTAGAQQPHDDETPHACEHEAVAKTPKKRPPPREGRWKIFLLARGRPPRQEAPRGGRPE